MIIREERIGGQRLILGDCLAVMPLLGKVDAVVTDPPYGLAEKLQGGTWARSLPVQIMIGMPARRQRLFCRLNCLQ